MTDLSRVRAIVASWRESTELSAARCMSEIASVLGIEPPRPVPGRVRKMESSRSGGSITEKSEPGTSPDT